MKTALGKLTKLIAVLVLGTLLFAPMRFGTEDYLYARPRSVRMNPGDSYPITYRLYSDVQQKVSYSSTNEEVATVNDSGLVTGVGPGNASIRLDAENGARATVQIHVAGLTASTLTLNTDSITMEKGQITGLKAVFNDKADNTLVRWHSDDERVAKVDAVGRVSGMGGGDTRITVTSADGLTASADVHVHVSGNAMRITPESVTVGAGTYLRLNTRYIPADTTDTVTHWTSSDESVLRVQSDGTLYAVSEGQAILGVFSRDGLSASTVITVAKPAVDFEIAPAAATMDRGNKMSLQARFIDAQGNVDADSSSHYITWTSSDPSVATVEDGTVTAVSSGTARISASADGKIASCSLKVQTLVEEVRLNMDQLYVLREQTVMPIQLEAEVVPADADDRRLTWSADNDLVATVNQRGLVSLVGGYGTAVITAANKSGAQARFVVNVVATLPEGAEYVGDGQ